MLERIERSDEEVGAEDVGLGRHSVQRGKDPVDAGHDGEPLHHPSVPGRRVMRPRRGRHGDMADGDHTTRTRSTGADTAAPATDGDLIGDRLGDEPVITFTNYCGTLTGVGPRHRNWRIMPTLLGWRLEYRDSDSADWTYAGLKQTRRGAEQEAQRMSRSGPVG